MQDIISLESVQRNATKLIPQIRSLPYSKRLAAIGLPYLFERMTRGDLIQYFKIVRGLNQVNWINPNQPFSSAAVDGPAGGIRAGNEHRLKREANTNYRPREHFLSNRVLSIWNVLPNEIASASSVNVFKSKLDIFLIEYYKKDDFHLKLVTVLN